MITWGRGKCSEITFYYIKKGERERERERES